MESRSWQKLDTQAEIDNLMSLFGNFHDACIREIHLVSGHDVDENLSMTLDWRMTARMLIQRQYRSPSAEMKYGATWIAARRASWRDASAWMGPDLRYCPPAL